jgi:hypothetical protein
MVGSAIISGPFAVVTEFRLLMDIAAAVLYAETGGRETYLSGPARL